MHPGRAVGRIVCGYLCCVLLCYVLLTSYVVAELVQNQDKDVLVFFHASWCGYCQKFSPIYDELGEKFHSSENIVIAKIDAIENDIDDIMEGVVVESFPTLYYVSGPKNEKTAVLYEGSRDLKDLIEYVNFQSGSSVSVDVDHSEL